LVIGHWLFGFRPLVIGPLVIGISVVEALVLRFINLATYSVGTPVRTELVEVRAFVVRQAHHERKALRGRNSEKQDLASSPLS
jgi:hypothetical protein